MPNNDFSILLQAFLDENASISNIDSNIDTIQGKVKNIQIKAILDPKSMNHITEQIAKAVNQKISISNINLDTGQAVKDAKQIGQQIGVNANKSAQESLKIDEVINNALKRMSHLTGREQNKLFGNRLDGAADVLKNNTELMNLFNNAVSQTFNVSSLNNLVNILKNSQKEFMSTEEIAKQFSAVISSQFITEIPASQKLSSGIFEVCRAFQQFNLETQNIGNQTSGENFFNWLSTNATQAQKDIFKVSEGFSSFQKVLNGLTVNNNNLFNYSTTLGLDTLNYNIEDIEKLIQSESKLISESNMADKELQGLRDTLIHTFNIRPNSDGSISVTLEQLQNISAKCPQAKQYIDKITLSLVQFNQSGISAAQSSASAANTIIQNEKRKQQAYNETAQAAKSMNGIVQNGSFPKNFLVSELNGSTKEVENTFKKLSSIVSIEERLGDATNLKGFTVSLTNADGVVEKLRYHLNEAGDAFTYMGGSVNNTGVEKQINSINEKASKLQNTFEGLKSKYSDLNAANPIKEVSHISELETQYKRVSQAIEAVKNSNSATFSSMTSNAEKEIKTLQRMGEEFKRAETISMRMNGSDISSGLAQAQERFQKLKADSAGFTQMAETIQKLDTAIASVGDKSSLKTFIDQLKVAEAQLGRVKAETRSMSQVNKIQFSLETGGYESKVESLISRTRQWTNEQGNARISTEALSKAFTDLNTAHDTLAKNNTAANQQALINAEKELDTQIKRVTNSVRTMNAQLTKDSTISSLHNRIQEFYDKNSAAHSKWGAQLKRMLAETASGAKLTHEQVRGLSTEFNNVGIAARQAGRLGKSFTQTLREGMRSFSYWTSSTFLVMKTIQSIKKAVSTVKELDTALVDLKKTTTMTASQLEEFYYNANDVAKRMGVTTNEIITQASAWSRLGYSSAEAATKMAKYSSMFASISPGMDIDTATNGLVSVMKAFDIGNDNPDEVLDGIMSKINVIGNTAATSNAEIVNMLAKSSSAMREANNTLEQTIALETAAVEITRDDDSVGTAFKTVSMRIRGKQTLPPYKETYMLCA